MRGNIGRFLRVHDFINSGMGSLLTRSLTTRRRNSNSFCSCPNFSIKTSSSFHFFDSSAIVYAPLSNLCVVTKPRSVSALTVVSKMPRINARITESSTVLYRLSVKSFSHCHERGLSISASCLDEK